MPARPPHPSPSPAAAISLRGPASAQARQQDRRRPGDLALHFHGYNEREELLELVGMDPCSLPTIRRDLETGVRDLVARVDTSAANKFGWAVRAPRTELNALQAVPAN